MIWNLAVALCYCTTVLIISLSYIEEFLCYWNFKGKDMVGMGSSGDHASNIPICDPPADFLGQILRQGQPLLCT